MKRIKSQTRKHREVYFNGDFIPEIEARISIFDCALMYGDMVFEMTRTFNCGIGMVLMVAERHAETVTQRLTDAGETVFPIGTVEAGTRGCDVDGTAGLWSAQSDWVAEHDH